VKRNEKKESKGKKKVERDGARAWPRGVGGEEEEG
jgi:hypothetical protein